MTGKLDRSRCLAVCSTLVVDGDRILLVQEGKEAVRGTWNLPAGKLEPGETPVEAAKRETAEEAGIQAEPEALIGVYLDDSDVSEDRVINLVFLARTDEPDATAADDDIQQVSWLSPDEALQHDLRAPYIPEAIQDWQDGRHVDLDRVNDLIH